MIHCSQERVVYLNDPKHIALSIYSEIQEEKQRARYVLTEHAALVRVWSNRINSNPSCRYNFKKNALESPHLLFSYAVQLQVERLNAPAEFLAPLVICHIFVKYRLERLNAPAEFLAPLVICHIFVKYRLKIRNLMRK